MPERKQVRITTGRAWYESMVGEVIEVIEWGGTYVCADDYERGAQATWYHVDPEHAEVVASNAISTKHDWRCISPGDYDTTYQCRRCGDRHTEQADNPVATRLPEYGCNNGDQ